MTSRNQTLGSELRRRRLAAGLTLAELAAAVHYSKGHLSKVEHGKKAPSRELARLCDAALRTGGVLTQLLFARAQQDMPAAETQPGPEEEIWIMQLSPDNSGSWFQPIGRRQLVTAGLSSAMAVGIRQPIFVGASAAKELAPDVEAFRRLFDNYRRLGQSVGPGVLLPALIAQTHALRQLSAFARPSVRQDLLRLGSRYAEYVGWLTQETGDDKAALWWTQRAVELAAAGGDRNLAAYAKVRHALITLYREEGDGTVALARQAQNSALPPRVRGLAVQREAQGHAINGDHDACMRRLDDARELLTEGTPRDGAPIFGTTHLTDPVAMITGWCLLDLGRPRQAAEVLDREMAQVPAHALRTNARYGVRRARAHAMAGDIDHACALTGHLLPDALTVSSATINADLRLLARTLARYPRNPSVQALAPDLSAALDVVTP